MVLDQIKNLASYEGIHPGILRGLQYLQTVDYDTLKLGRNEIDGEDLYALKQEYDTVANSEGCWESHRTYADIQFIHDGDEWIGYAPLQSMTATTPYIQEDDYVLYQGTGQFLHLKQGWFLILLPQDVHMPAVNLGDPAKVKKIVVKVRLSFPS